MGSFVNCISFSFLKFLRILLTKFSVLNLGTFEHVTSFTTSLIFSTNPNVVKKTSLQRHISLRRHNFIMFNVVKRHICWVHKAHTLRHHNTFPFKIRADHVDDCNVDVDSLKRKSTSKFVAPLKLTATLPYHVIHRKAHKSQVPKNSSRLYPIRCFRLHFCGRLTWKHFSKCEENFIRLGCAD